jgi:SPP1 gp7 family putative phage head morphogenesis protein
LGLKQRKQLVFHAQDEPGKWITVKGNHIFIPEGRDVGEVIKEKFEDKGKAKSVSKEAKIYAKKTDVEEVKGWANDPVRYQWKSKPGSLIHGKPLDIKELPKEIYHVTTAADKVDKSGVLLGQHADAGLGGGTEDGVSFTSSKSDADLIQRELLRSVKIAKGSLGIDDFPSIAREDEKIAGLPEGTLDKAIASARVGYDLHVKLRTEEGKDPNKPSLMKDAYNHYLFARESAAEKVSASAKEAIKNPILYGDQAKLKEIDEAQIKTLVVPKTSLPSEALVTTGSDDFLHEVRVFADVPIKQSSFPSKEPKPVKAVTKQVDTPESLPKEPRTIPVDTSLSPQEKSAVEEYSRGLYKSDVGGYTNIQGILRTGTPEYRDSWDEEKGKAHVKNLLSAFQKSTLPEEKTLYRGIRSTKEYNITDMKVGDEFFDKGVTSTSTSQQLVKKHFGRKLNRRDTTVYLTIKAAKGTHAIEIGGPEKEVAIAPNTTFIVTKKTVRNGIIYLNVETKSKSQLTTHAAGGRWIFQSTEQKLKAFQQWLKQKIALHLVQEQMDDENAWWNKYIMEGFKKGTARAFDDTRPQVKAAMQKDQQAVSDFYAGTKDEFLRSSFNWPTSREKVKLLASRTYTDLKGVTEGMSARISHDLVDGLTKGDSPLTIARQLSKDVDISRSRAETIARTEIIRTHAEGQLDAFEKLGVTAVGVMAEWSTAEDDRVCPLCQPLDGTVLKVQEARGLLPRHPNCRCAWIPANVGEDEKEQKRSKSVIELAIEKSYQAELPSTSKRTIAEQKKLSRWGGADKVISKKRPKSILSKVRNARFSTGICNINENGRWITIRGNHVFIDDKGNITKGPKHLTGKNVNELKDATKIKGVKIFDGVTGSDKVRKLYDEQHKPSNSYRNLTQDIANKLAAKNTFVAISSETLSEILTEGKFKTAYETKESSGYFDAKQRASFEEEYFGSKPIYGYLSDSGQASRISKKETASGDSYSTDEVSIYGPVRIKLKTHMRERTTFVQGDSWDSNHVGVLQASSEDSISTLASPVNKPSYKSIPTWENIKHLKDSLVERHKEWLDDNTRPFYCEAQIHGILNVSDIDSIIFYDEPPDKALSSQLAKNGIKWKMKKFK